ncbi:MAG: hypothetical protein WCK63_16740 [Betaproteobacteria bacterium]
MKTPLFMALVLACISGCKPSPMGTKVDWDTVIQFTPGVSTAPEVVAKLGPATLISKTPNNGAKFRWTYMEPKSYREVDIQTLELSFDSNSKLLEMPGNKIIVQHLNKYKRLG